MSECETRSWYFRAAKVTDVEFLGKAIRDSERAHTGKGIWDVAIGEHEEEDKSLAAVLAHACEKDVLCHFHYSHFLVVVAGAQPTISTAQDQTQENSNASEEKDGNEDIIVGAGCCFLYPNFSVSRSYPGMSLATRLLRGVSEEDSVAMWEKISFLDVVFPEYDYDNTWMLESVLVAASHRKLGIAVELITRLFEQGRFSGARECLVVCGIGNTAAYRMYEKAGFECVGKGESDQALAVMGYAGFHLFRKAYL